MKLSDWHEESITRSHNRASFDCGEPDLNEFLRKHARQSHDKGAAKTFLAISNSDGKTFLGYCSLCRASLLSFVAHKPLPGESVDDDEVIETPTDDEVPADSPPF